MARILQYPHIRKHTQTYLHINIQHILPCSSWPTIPSSTQKCLETHTYKHTKLRMWTPKQLDQTMPYNFWLQELESNFFLQLNLSSPFRIIVVWYRLQLLRNRYWLFDLFREIQLWRKCHSLTVNAVSHSPFSSGFFLFFSFSTFQTIGKAANFLINYLSL